jgi:DNA-binding Xre family transcriptional regulator
MNYNELKDIAESKKIEIKDIASELEMTTNGFRESIKRETIQLKKLSKLCTLMRINPLLFFEHIPSTYISAGGHVQNGNNNQIIIESKDREIELLKEQIKAKDEIILLLKK